MLVQDLCVGAYVYAKGENAFLFRADDLSKTTRRHDAQQLAAMVAPSHPKGLWGALARGL